MNPLRRKPLVMQRTRHLFENSIYLISNHSVARNPMFSNMRMQKYFIKKMQKYLAPISDILAYSMDDHEFQILVKLKGREDFVDHFISKKGQGKSDVNDIPESTYIFSKAMANLQISFVKHFNWYYERTGSLVAGRFQRKLVETEEEMASWVTKLNKAIKKHNYSGIWANDIMNNQVAETSLWFYNGGESLVPIGIEVLLNAQSSDLASSFASLPPKSLSSTRNYFLNQINRLFTTTSRFNE